MEELGFKVCIGEHINRKNSYTAGKPKNKASDINKMFANDEVKAIICTKGGDTANSTLPYLNFELIRRKPKIFMGFSDITVLLNAIAFKSGVVTYLGPDIVWKFGHNFSDYDKSEFESILINKNSVIKSNSKWLLINKSIKKKFSGVLWGGNIRCFLKLLGTDYFPKIKNGILLIEDVKKTSAWFDSILTQLEQIGVLQNLNGIIIGHNYKCEEDGEINKKFEDIVLEKTKNLDINIIKISEFGHNSDHSVFPIGQKVMVDVEGQIINF